MNRIVVTRLLESRRRVLAMTWAARAAVIRQQLIAERTTAQ